MPPLDGVAVNITDVPEQIVVALADAITLGVTFAVTAIVTWPDVAVFDELQVAVEVITTSNMSPFVIELVVYVTALAPEIGVEYFLH